MTPSARIAAAIALVADVDASPRRPADATANDFFRGRRYIGSGDRRAVAERAWGVLRQRLRLTWHLEKVGLPADARHLVMAHLLLAEGWTPDGVEQGFPGGRFNPPPLDPGERKAVAALAGRPLASSEMPEATRLNLPDWALESFRARFGEELPAEAEAMDAAAPLDLRVNLLRATREQAAAALAAERIQTEPTPYSPWGLRLPDRRPILASKAFADGLVEIQDEGSQLIALLTGAKPGMRVADYCAGAAGKTLAVAATMANKGRIVACDVSATRLEGAVKRLRRAGVDNAERHLLTPGDRWVKRRAGQFDRVLVDAPCTGTGTWRRNPDARLRTTPRDVAELTAKQHDILESTASLVAKGGRLVYATCSVLPEENVTQVEGFLARHQEFEAVPFAQAWAEATDTPPPAVDGPWMQLSPHRHGTDGFFTAVLQRRS
ncbi:RsmB/NOP family class I SAM-dependent RNA methyltransferase [Roseomonas marmotae]|uniref:RsmB/NOP family class I SAM-dependent RNA methyltransferase n=1 Tax=Roseomonas marmotae TaxID=2768161 RepID=A0ABS3KFN0_9PROT|nr:RsmB/NOP family class I SAM-dependent RNA methyltransferase [Roseomonas marmotae]MBO1076227.1 RsmB/NOP family class I SAM-dependent RNA methyltransferase [Roseomonas marmotae]QTI77888.1 RsmB/NOP family class I SAM-dependent RNA methyltransferase [Roseomonas marmotae]